MTVVIDDGNETDHFGVNAIYVGVVDGQRDRICGRWR